MRGLLPIYLVLAPLALGHIVHNQSKFPWTEVTSTLENSNLNATVEHESFQEEKKDKELLKLLDSSYAPLSNEYELKSTRANGTTPSFQDEDKFFLSWLQYILGYNQSQITTTPAPEVEVPLCSSCVCGITNKQKRIVGGIETQVNEYPWVALLMYRGRFYCGASIINSKYVLTAAHCVDRFQKTLMSVRILEHDRNSTNEAVHQDFRVKEVIRHAQYSTVNYNNDLALIKIDGEFEFDSKMKPVCLAERAKTFTGETGIATGWGATAEGGPVSTTLREVSVPIMSNTECRASKYPARKITDNMLCAGYKEGQKDSCQGDSGGPLHVASDGNHRVVGIVSWGEGCAQPGYPGVYTRVNRYLTWILKNTEDACYCSDQATVKKSS